MSLHQVDESLLEPWRYLVAIPGKDVRGKLIDAFQLWMKIPTDKVVVIKEIVGDLHNASLLVDDIEDNSLLRRGVPVAHAIYGIASTINTANYVYFLAMEKCINLESPEAMRVFCAELLNLHKGQGQDILWRDHGNCPTEEQYREMVLNKTGGLFRLTISLMQALSESKADFIPLVNKMALYFQIRDDFINLNSAEYMRNKSFCEDITEGKFSFPVIHAIRTKPEDKRLLNILKQKTDSESLKKHAVDFMRAAGSFKYTRSVLSKLKEDVLEEIKVLGGHKLLEKVIEDLNKQMEMECSKDDEIPVILTTGKPPSPPYSL